MAANQNFPKKTTIRDKAYLPAQFLPSHADVVCGRGKDCFNHEGNVVFRAMINAVLPRYTTLQTKTEKTIVVADIVDRVRARGGKFVRFDRPKGQWCEIGDEAAREKCGQTIREALVKQNPKKRAEKRLRRAICKAKRTNEAGSKTKALEQQLEQELATASNGPIRPVTVPATNSSDSDDYSWSQPEREVSSQKPIEPQAPLFSKEGLEALASRYQKLKLYAMSMERLLEFERASLLSSTSRIVAKREVPSVMELHKHSSVADAILASFPPELAMKSSGSWFTPRTVTGMRLDAVLR